MATIKEVYKLLKLKKENGENIGMFGESYIEMYEKNKEPSTTKEISVSFIKNKDREYPHWVIPWHLIKLAMGFLLPIIKLIAWTVGGFILFGICAFIKEALEPKIGGFAFVIAAILFLVGLTIFAGFVNMDLGPERGPRFFGDPG